MGASEQLLVLSNNALLCFFPRIAIVQARELWEVAIVIYNVAQLH
jgi:hypothetical protein